MSSTKTTNLQDFTILLVDDRPENLMSLEEILEAPNRKFLKAYSGNEALKFALKDESIGLIMLDVQMPGMDGFEVARLLKSNPRTRDISIIFVTAISRDEQYVLKGFEEGAVDYLQKPLDINLTLAKVRVFEQLYFYQRDLRMALLEKESVNKQLERFMYVVAHDLKSPLAGVISLLSLLKDDERLQEVDDLKEYMGMMIDATGHLSGMITSILEYSRNSESLQSKEEVDVHEMVEQIIRLLFAPKHIDIWIEGQLPVIFTHKLKLQQVLQNLISNSIKYNDKAEGRITVNATQDGERFVFCVSDNGPGVAEEDQQRIFKLFETTANKSQQDSSTGVGLNLVKMFVEEKGGKIWVDSIEGEGSRFYFSWVPG
ncbi:MAG: hybrid sensor histidine kinase/response regulator [Sphingobacteriales bacterium]|nr:MAG: hybrid sensor histidine kinase/response regulator [Sphingobacteriales bacterium]